MRDIPTVIVICAEQWCGHTHTTHKAALKCLRRFGPAARAVSRERSFDNWQLLSASEQIKAERFQQKLNDLRKGGLNP